MDNKILKFPAGFLWGAATSAYQIEGGLVNDWSEWEKSPRRLAELKAKGLNPLDFQSAQAVNSWEMLEADIECLKKINATAYRFSIDWSRIEPEEGRFDEVVLSRYASFIARLREEKIEPFVTLWHWPLPLWLKAKGGWTSLKIVECFKNFTDRVVDAFPTVKFWMTLNEPEGYAGNSYLIGIWPPQRTNLFTYNKVLKNLIKAHHAAYKIIKEKLPDSKISIATPRAHFVSAADPLSKLFTKIAAWWWNDRFLKRIINSIDFIGLNYYWWINVKFLSFSKTKGPVVSEMGWTINAEGIYYSLLDLKKYNKPIYITENGLADEHDKQRAWFIESMLQQVHRAINQGVDVRGYLHWSLLDNFEWSHGFGKKFGLFSVDHQTFERRARASVETYAKIAGSNELII